MKKITVLFFSLVLTFFICANSMAQEKAVTKIAFVKHNKEIINFTLTSSKPFIFGGNRYMLYIGDKDFTRYEQSKNNGKGTLTFFIPAEDFNALKEGASIYLSYGRVTNGGTQDLEEVSKQSRRCWSLGKFSNKLLTK